MAIRMVRKSYPVLSLSVGSLYRISIIYTISTVPYASNVLKVYYERQELIFANVTDLGTEKLNGISKDFISGVCPTYEGFENMQILFSCAENQLALFQGESGELKCDTLEYFIHVNSAYWIHGGDPEVPPQIAFYILKK